MLIVTELKFLVSEIIGRREAGHWEDFPGSWGERDWNGVTWMGFLHPPVRGELCKLSSIKR